MPFDFGNGRHVVGVELAGGERAVPAPVRGGADAVQADVQGNALGLGVDDRAFFLGMMDFLRWRCTKCPVAGWNGRRCTDRIRDALSTMRHLVRQEAGTST